MFRTKKEQPKSLKEFKPWYIQFIKNITKDNIIESKKIQLKGVRKQFYNYNDQNISHHINLNEELKYNPELKTIDEKYHKILKIEQPKNDKMKLNCNNLDEDVFIEWKKLI